MRITVAGIGYVGLSNAVLLSQHNKVTAFDINTDRVDMINKKISPIVDKDSQQNILLIKIWFMCCKSSGDSV